MDLQQRGVRYHVSTYNEDALGYPLLLLHGFAQTSETWQEVAPRLAQNRPVFALDFAGFGQSERPDHDEPYRIDEMIFAVDALAEQVGTPVHLLGYSMGGRVAAGYAKARPAKVASLILESAGLGPETPEQRACLNARDALLVNRLERVNISEFVDWWEELPLFASQKKLPQSLRDRLRQERCTSDPAVLARCVRGAGQHAMPYFEECLCGLSMPFLYMAGSADNKYTMVATKLAARRVAKCALLSAGHNVHEENPVSFCDHVESFLALQSEQISEGSL